MSLAYVWTTKLPDVLFGQLIFCPFFIDLLIEHFEIVIFKQNTILTAIAATNESLIFWFNFFNSFIMDK